MAENDIPDWVREAQQGGTIVVTAPTPDGKYSTERAMDHALAVEWFVDQGVPRGVASDMVNDIAEQHRSSSGDWPSITQVVANRSAVNQAAWASGGLYALPSSFGVRNPDGTITYYRNDPQSGLSVLPTGDVDSGLGRFQRDRIRNVPIFRPDEIQRLLGSAGDGPPGGGGGGGGVGSQPPVWDRDQLVEAAADKWRGMLLSEPGDVGRLVDDYMTRATSFFEQGGRLDFDTFITNRLRETSRYRLLYQHKTPGLSEDAYMAQYVNAFRNLGLADRNLGGTVTQGMTSGASVQGFTERLSRGAEFMAANQGQFSQKFGNLISQLGIRGT